MSRTVFPRNTGNFLALLAAFSILSGLVTGLEAQVRVQHSSKYACPVTADLFPKQERSGDVLKFTFPENEGEIPTGGADDLSGVARRISISLLTPDGQDIEIPFRWKGVVFINPRIDWGERSGVFVAKGDGNPSCFFLGPTAELPSNIPCVEFDLTVPADVKVREVSFSTLGGEFVSEYCPMPELEKQINEAYEDSQSAPQDAVKTEKFISLLEKTLPEYECISKGGGEPIPALFLAGFETIWNWIDHLYLKVDEANDHALLVFAGIFDKMHGHLGEEMSDQIWKVMRDKPRFILKNWADLRSFKNSILDSRWLHSPADNILMVEVYRDISIKEPKYKTACDEIISILSKKWLP